MSNRLEGPGKLANELASIWDNVYEKKISIDHIKRREKHLLYYDTLSQLGFFNNLQDNAIVVQGGCGHGSAVRLMVDLENQSRIVPIGIDISRKALSTAKAHNSLDVLEGDISRLPLASNSVDRFFEVGVVEHFYRDGILIPRVDRPLIVKSFQETTRVLKKGGIAAFIQPSNLSFGMIEHKVRDYMRTWDMGFQEDFFIEDFSQLMELGGFENIKYSVIPASGDLPKIINIMDSVAINLAKLLGLTKIVDNIGMFFVVTGSKL